MALETIKYETEIKIANMPYAWLSNLELFDPYLLNYPLSYVHLIEGTDRVYGFVVGSIIEAIVGNNERCNLKLIFLSNKDLSNKPTLKRAIEKELNNRMGISDAIDLNTLISCCKSNRDYEEIIKKLWQKNIELNGNAIPFGRFYEEFYAIVRFCAAFNPSSGRKSEMQMVYDFISNYGEKIKIEGKWSFLQFYLLPIYYDIKTINFNDFPIFKILYESIVKIFNIFYTQNNRFGNVTLKMIASRTDMFKSGKAYRLKTTELVSRAIITAKDKQVLDFLLDAFNRYPARARIFISFLGNINTNNDYSNWNKDEFIHFYQDNPKGFSMKVAGCFLQQGFGNSEVIPIDNWVESFYMNIFNIKDNKIFLNSFDKLGKLERFIWFLAQARKTNNSMVFDQMWCIKYGVPYDYLRGPNPLSCYECRLRSACPAYKNILNEKVLVKDTENISKSEEYKKNNDLKWIKIDSQDIITKAKEENCKFICETQDKVPKYIFKEVKEDKWVLIDEYSGFFVHTNKLSESDQIITVEEFISQLGDFDFNFSPIL